MSATIAIEIPREILHVTRMTPQALKQERGRSYGISMMRERSRWAQGGGIAGGERPHF